MNKLAHKLIRAAHSSPTQRQSPVTDIRFLTVLVLESYEQTVSHSRPKVQRRYEKLLRELKSGGKACTLRCSLARITREVVLMSPEEDGSS